MAWYIGLMSGTSMDGVDAVLARFDPPSAQTPSPSQASTWIPAYHAHFEHAVSVPLADELSAELLALNQAGENELLRAARAAQALVKHYSQAVHQLLSESQLKATDITAIGAHGQTVRHLPDEGISIQINAPALLAEQTGIDVIADFRSRDLAAGGQGAPLVPPFHAYLFGSPHPRAVVNIGGMANITVLEPSSFYGFDCGPGNVLMDLWCARHLQQPFEKQGLWAASGRCHDKLLDTLLSEPWLKLCPPKSTGRDLFNLDWLQKNLAAPAFQALSAADIQATLLEYTARSIIEALCRWAPHTQDIIICGGGAHNTYLMQRLQHLANHLLTASIHSSSEFGIHPQYIEAYAFAWLAFAYDKKINAGYPQVTGAHRPTCLGARYYK